MSDEGYLSHFEPHGATPRSSTAVPKTRWARTVDGVWIAYQDFGHGPLTLVFMNGLYSHLEVYWELPAFARFMNRLGAGVRVRQLSWESLSPPAARWRSRVSPVPRRRR